MSNVEKICQLAAEAVWQGVLVSNKVVEATIVLADDPLVQSLNYKHRNINKPTNVLSFTADNNNVAIDGDVPSLGDIVMAFETIKNEAPDHVSDHLSHLVVHGCLHLLGYSHANDKEANAMETLEVEMLAGLGIKDPYGKNCALKLRNAN